MFEKLINKENFEKLCSIEQKRVYLENEMPSHLFYLNNDNELQSILLNLLGVDFCKKEKWDNVVNIQLSENFKEWLLQEWQEPCLN
jgi:hypothetical protein